MSRRPPAAPRGYTATRRCRACGNPSLLPVLSLGRQALTGVFPRTPAQKVTSGPLDLVKCDEAKGGEACGLVQLRHSYDLEELYGDNYGYRSGLNPSMVAHLTGKVRRIVAEVPLRRGDVVVDVGSNDGTLLKSYPRRGLRLIGVDPTGRTFRRFYPDHIELIPDFFSSKALLARTGGRKARVLTSISMFYDLEAPLEFMRQVAEVLDGDGVWVMEQSYLPAMLEATAYDTVCHEHLEYYGLRQIRWMARRAGLKIIDAELNGTNGGSFSIMLAHADSPRLSNDATLDAMMRRELPLAGLRPFESFRRRVEKHRAELRRFFAKARKAGKVVHGYGASTKGNVILQYCGLTARDLPCIGEVNPDKFGCVTPGSRIPIVSEYEAKSSNPDYLMVLPWHFRDFIVKKESGYLQDGGKLLFPLPRIEVC